MAIIDAHAHLSIRRGAKEQLLASMDACGINESFVVAGGIVTPLELSRCLNDNVVINKTCDIDNLPKS